MSHSEEIKYIEKQDNIPKNKPKKSIDNFGVSDVIEDIFMWGRKLDIGPAKLHENL